MKKLFFACFISLTTLLFAEQKVIKISPTKSYGFRVDDNVIESTLNSFIRNGYRIVSITPITQKIGNGSCTTHLIVIIEKEEALCGKKQPSARICGKSNDRFACLVVDKTDFKTGIYCGRETPQFIGREISTL